MADWITNITDSMGYFGVALLMFLENIFPPIPSELVMPAAGFGARQGDQTLWGVILAGSLGSLAGTIPWYLAARWVGPKRLKSWVQRRGKWLALSVDDIDRSTRWFDRWGTTAVLIGRLVPGIRTLISVPAGFAKMPWWQFLMWSAIGTAAWSALLAVLGWYLRDNYRVLKPYLTGISIAVIGGLVVWFIVWSVKRYRSRESSQSA